MFNKMKNILTFGLYNRLVQAECDLIKAKEASYSYYSELKRTIENLDIDGAVEEEINKRDILTQDNFSPSDFDIVTSDDYDFDDFMTRDDVEDETRGLVHEDDIHNVIENKIDDGFKSAIDNSAERIVNDNILDLAHKVLEQRKEK